MKKGSALYLSTTSTLKNRGFYRLYILGLLLVYCAIFYYFGEILDFFKVNPSGLAFFYGVHDIQRTVFLAPIIYAGYHGRVRSAIIITLISLMIMLPRGLFISPFPDPLLRMMLFIVIAGTIGIFTGITQNKAYRVKQLETELRNDRDKLLNIVDSISEGILITDPDYKIRFMNSSMVKDHGEGIGLPCYKYLYNLENPCEQNCLIREVIDEKQVKKRDYIIKDFVYNVVSTPYVDLDGTVCHLSIFRKTDSH